MNSLSDSLLDCMNNLFANTDFHMQEWKHCHPYALGNPPLISSVQSLTCAVYPALTMQNNSNRKAYDVPFHLYV